MKHAKLLGVFHQHKFDYKDLNILIEEIGEDAVVDLNPSDITFYESTCEAFYELYPNSVEEFKREKCEDYQLIFTDYSEFYVDWLADHYNCHWLNNDHLVIID